MGGRATGGGGVARPGRKKPRGACKIFSPCVPPLEGTGEARPAATEVERGSLPSYFPVSLDT